MTANASLRVGLTMRVTYSRKRDHEHAQRREDRRADDAVGLGVEHGRDRTEAESLAHRVQRAEKRRPQRLHRDEDAEEEGAEARQPESAGDGDGGVGVSAADVDPDRFGGGGPSPRTAGHEHDQQDQRLDADAGDRHRPRRSRGELGLDELLAQRRVARTDGRRCIRCLCHVVPPVSLSGRGETADGNPRLMDRRAAKGRNSKEGHTPTSAQAGVTERS